MGDDNVSQQKVVIWRQIRAECVKEDTKGRSSIHGRRHEEHHRQKRRMWRAFSPGRRRKTGRVGRGGPHGRAEVTRLTGKRKRILCIFANYIASKCVSVDEKVAVVAGSMKVGTFDFTLCRYRRGFSGGRTPYWYVRTLPQLSSLIAGHPPVALVGRVARRGARLGALAAPSSPGAAATCHGRAAARAPSGR